MDKKKWQLIERRLVLSGNHAYVTSHTFFYENLTRSKVEAIVAERLSYNSDIVSIFIREFTPEESNE